MRYRLAASAEMLFIEQPFIERVRHLHERGFLVEIWDWTQKDLPALAATGAKFSSMTGYIEGDLIDPDGSERFLATARQSAMAAAIIDSPRLNVHGTGLDGNGHPIKAIQNVTGHDWLCARDTLARLADIGAEFGRVFTLENLNLLVDHPGTPFGRADDTIALVEAVNHPNLRLNLDLYHAQIGEGNLVELVRRALPLIGEIQVADVPGRCEPGSGEVNYPRIAAELRALEYDGVVGLEAWATSDPDAALDAFAAAFAEQP